ncbi:MAG: hypothetical protein COU08_00510 [Candidatus Harrisonbacteria bacterium CG10_big_fil_rev_8_21_14_0_10_42_17]|uniref:Guanylate cyclase domain-containing protein n=1 Tax=Candidatus Harrisonbacteria bacterium CG10_big_fil_rev_8_21_14_0_10_42_17 TaxID=1974584 RepID=A0A2M6WJ51_9BACT|nr:MAG: hypothetical protein COU08_00510 [Candidatus Harrisonbacteria bacterium CG10_big_fil_rev_8_21_14_0_10_42_17]
MERFTKRKSKLLIPLSIAALTILLFLGGFFGTASDKLTDLLFTNTELASDIVIVAIDDESIQQIGQWPWERNVFAQLITALDTASVIGIDVNFKEPSQRGIADDQALASAIRNSNAPVVLSTDLQENGETRGPLQELKQAAEVGFTNILTSPDAIVRNMIVEKNGVPNFGFQIKKTQKPEKEDELKNIFRKTPRIYFYGQKETFPIISTYAILEGTIPKAFIQNKIILIGATAPDLQDFHKTSVGIMSGIELQANIIQTLEDENLLRENKALNVASIILLTLIAAGITLSLKKFLPLLLTLVGVLVAYNLVAFIGFNVRTILDLLYPNSAFILTAGATIAAQYITTKKEKQFIQSSFSRYLAPQVIDELVEDPGKLTLGGERKKLTILFSDIRGFTSISEKMSPEELTHFLNHYLTNMTMIVLKRNGLVDKFIGDAIMALWGTPLANKKQARDGVQAALEMIESLEKFNNEPEHKDQPDIKIGIGLHTGDAIVGNMGSETRFDYTAMGDNINLASRIEGLNKPYGTQIIVSEALLNELTEEDKRELNITAREIDQVQVKGKKNGVKIFEIVPWTKCEEVEKIMQHFHEAREYYYRGAWDKALTTLEVILKINPEDGPSLLMKARIEELKQNPPENWEGVFTMKTK